MPDENIVQQFLVTVVLRKPLPHLIDTIANHLSTVDKIKEVGVNAIEPGVELTGVIPNRSVPPTRIREEAFRDAELVSRGMPAGQHRHHWHYGFKGMTCPAGASADERDAFYDGRARRHELQRDELVGSAERTRAELAFDNIGKPRTHFSGYLVSGPTVSDEATNTGFMQLDDDESTSKAMDRLARELLGIGA